MWLADTGKATLEYASNIGREGERISMRIIKEVLGWGFVVI